MYKILLGGYNSKHPKSFLLSRPQGAENYVILHITTPTHFLIEGNTFEIVSNSIIVLRPHTPYQYSAMNTEFKNDWLHFTCDRDDFESRYGHLLNHPISVQNSLQFSQYFQHILWEYHYGSQQHKEINITMLFQVMFNKIIQEYMESSNFKKTSPYASRLKELRLTIQSQPNRNFDANELAAFLNVSPSYFQHLYRDFFGKPFKKDMIELRLEFARDLIVNTTLPFEQIACMSGYTNEIHFYRQFKAKTGMTPNEYRSLSTT